MEYVIICILLPTYKSDIVAQQLHIFSIVFWKTSDYFQKAPTAI